MSLLRGSNGLQFGFKLHVFPVRYTAVQVSSLQRETGLGHLGHRKTPVSSSKNEEAAA